MITRNRGNSTARDRIDEPIRRLLCINAHRVNLGVPFDEAIERIVHELGENGFAVISWIDRRDKLIERLGADFRSYVVMSAFALTRS